MIASPFSRDAILRALAASTPPLTANEVAAVVAIAARLHRAPTVAEVKLVFAQLHRMAIEGAVRRAGVAAFERNRKPRVLWARAA